MAEGSVALFQAFLDSLEGEPGQDGRDLELDATGGLLRYRLAGDTDWKPLYDLTALKGEPGENGTGGSNTLKESLHAAIPTNNSTDCGPAIQAIYDAGFNLELNAKVTYYINTPIFLDRDTLQNPFVVNLNGASLRLGTGLPVVTNALNGTTKFAFLPNVLRTIPRGSGSMTLSETYRATGSSGKYGGLQINNGYWYTASAADVGLVCTYTSAVILNGVHQNGGRTSLTWVGYTEPHTILQGTFTSAGGANQVADAWYVYGKSEGDGLTVNSMKCSGAVGGVSLDGCHGAVLNGLISTRVRLEECASIDIIGMHNESMMTTYPGNVVIRSSDVNFYGGIMYMTRPEMQDITLADSKGMVLITDSHNERASTVSYNDMVTAYFQRSPYTTTPLDPPIHFEYANPGTTLKVRNHKSLLISIGSPGVWRRTTSPVLSSRVAAPGLDSVYARSLIASGDFAVVNSTLTYASNGTTSGLKVVPYSGSMVARRMLVPPWGLDLYADNGVGAGSLTAGTTYHYTVAFRNAAGEYTNYRAPVSRAADADRTMRLRITNPNSDCVAVIWRKNAAGVENAPDWYVEIPLSSAVTWLLDMGPHIGGWTWLPGAGRIPNTVAATNGTTAGVLVDGVPV